MPKLKRQNAFTDDQKHESFIEIQCRICHEYEPCGEWVKIQCYCCNSTAKYYYAHILCLQRVNWCKVCQKRHEIIMKQCSSRNKKEEHRRYSILKEIRVKYQNTIMISAVILLSLLVFYDLCKCISLDKVGQDELQGLTQAEYLWLPGSFEVLSHQNKFFFI